MKLLKPWDNFSAVNYTEFTVSNDLNPQNKSLANAFQTNFWYYILEKFGPEQQ